MNIKGWTGIVGVAVLTAGWLVSGQLWAQTKLSDGYTLEDFSLRTTGDLVDICTLEQSHPDFIAAKAFCYGFFEGGIHYDDAISTSPTYKRISCSPSGDNAYGSRGGLRHLRSDQPPVCLESTDRHDLPCPWSPNGRARDDRLLMIP